jgi:adenosylcobinamide kinase/adenosylcobinamide-phosphate guanylyltransferase
MITLISGGSGSGKSAFAEALVIKSGVSPRIYLATMQVWGAEDVQRVERHRFMRQNKGFSTIECPKGLDKLTLPAHSVVLLEDLSNLTANECFGGEGFDGAEQRILNGIYHVQQQVQDIVIVTNELFSDGIAYPPETARYLELLAQLNRSLAEEAQQVIEVVAGIPIWWKGKNS